MKDWTDIDPHTAKKRRKKDKRKTAWWRHPIHKLNVLPDDFDYSRYPHINFDSSQFQSAAEAIEQVYNHKQHGDNLYVRDMLNVFGELPYNPGRVFFLRFVKRIMRGYRIIGRDGLKRLNVAHNILELCDHFCFITDIRKDKKRKSACFRNAHRHVHLHTKWNKTKSWEPKFKLRVNKKKRNLHRKEEHRKILREVRRKWKLRFRHTLGHSKPTYVVPKVLNWKEEWHPMVSYYLII